MPLFKHYRSSFKYNRFAFPILPEKEGITQRLMDGIHATKRPPLMENPAINFRSPTERLEVKLFISRRPGSYGLGKMPI